MAKKTDKLVHISVINAVCMVVVAMFFDTLQSIVGLIHIFDEFLLPFVIAYMLSASITIAAGSTHGLWFQMSGVSFMTLFKKNKGSLAMTLFAKLIPILDMLPAWTAFVIKTLVSSTDIVEQLLKTTGTGSAGGKVALKMGRKFILGT